jgi:hypothetical protein
MCEKHATNTMNSSPSVERKCARIVEDLMRQQPWQTYLKKREQQQQQQKILSAILFLGFSRGRLQSYVARNIPSSARGAHGTV